jgi:hypothetical protein
LAKIAADPEKCQAVIRARTRLLDADSDDKALVLERLAENMTDVCGIADPEAVRFWWPAAEMARLVSEALERKVQSNQLTHQFKILGITQIEFRRHRRKDVLGKSVPGSDRGCLWTGRPVDPKDQTVHYHPPAPSYTTPGPSSVAPTGPSPVVKAAATSQA